MMDLDSFKAYNDRHGHPGRRLAAPPGATAIYGAARSDDRVYRYGGDEFALILPDTGVAEAARVAGRIRRAVSALTDADPTPVTITVGVAAMPGDATRPRGPDRGGGHGPLLRQAGRRGPRRARRPLTADVGDLRGTLEEARRGRASGTATTSTPSSTSSSARRQLAGPHHDGQDSLRDALLTIARSFDGRGAAARGHADRVGRLASAVGGRLGLGDDERHSIELAGRLHLLDAHGVAELSSIPSLREVAALIEGYRRPRRPDRAARVRPRSAPTSSARRTTTTSSCPAAGDPRVGRAEAMAMLRASPAGYRRDVLERSPASSRSAGCRADGGADDDDHGPRRSAGRPGGIIPPPMTSSRLASLRPAGAAGLCALVGRDRPRRVLHAVADADARRRRAADRPATPAGPTPTPSPTPEPDAALHERAGPRPRALIPTEAAGAVVAVAPSDEFALTPGDIAVAFGEIGNRFSSRSLAYVEQRAARCTRCASTPGAVDRATWSRTLATAGRYVGIAGPRPEPWERPSSSTQRVWTVARGQRHRRRHAPVHVVERRHRLPAHRRRRRGQHGRSSRSCRASRRRRRRPVPSGSPSPPRSPSASSRGLTCIGLSSAPCWTRRPLVRMG